MPFRITARMILELGAELISSDAIAIYELVKNALDAGSDRVALRVQVLVPRSAYQGALDALADRTTTRRVLDDLRREVIDGAPPAASERFLGRLEEAVGNRTAFRRVLKNMYRREHWIEIADTGQGMTQTGLTEDFLTIGTRSRRRLKVSRLGRPLETGDAVLGDKGVGRLSAMRLGDRLTVTTSTSGERRWNRLEIDWNRFSHASDAMLEDVDVEPEYGDVKDDAARCGTTIRISALRANLDFDVFRSMVREEFSRIVDPLPPDRGDLAGRRANDIFDIEYNGRPHEIEGVPRWLLDQAHAVVNARFEIGEDGAATFSGTIEYRLRNKSRTFRLIETELLSLTDPIDDRKLRTTPRTLRELGPFSVSLYWYNRRILAETRVDTRTFRRAAVTAQVNEWAGGLMVFRNGFRINPYGSGEDDWLSLDRKALGARGYKVNRSQIIGRVALTSRNHRLVEQTNREGLADNDFKQLLVGMLRHLLITEFRTFLERVDASRRVLEQTTAEDLEARIKSTRAQAERSVVELMREAPDQRERLDGLLKLVKELGRLMDETRRLSAEYEDDKAKFTQLAGIGLMVEFILHEIGRTTARALEAVAEINPMQLASSDANALRVLEDQLRSLRKRVENLDPLSTSRRQIKENVDVIDVVRQVVSGRTAQFERHRINIEISGDDRSWPVKVVRGMLIGILENLIENSVYWLAMEAQGSKRFKPRLTIDLDCRLNEISVTDNGPGVDSHRAEEIFEPFVTAKPPGQGRGLGLYISRQMAATNGWSLAMSEDHGKRPGRYNTFVLKMDRTT